MTQMQVVACKAVGEKNCQIFPAVVLSVFRGSVCRRGKSAGKVKISKLMPVPLSASSVVKVHLMALRCVEGAWYEASPLSDVHMVDPARTVLGELQMESYKTGSVTLRVKLSEAAQKSLESLRGAKALAFPDVTSHKAQPSAPPKGTKALPYLTAADMSREKAPHGIYKFMGDLPARFAASGLRLVDAGGKVKVGGRQGQVAVSCHGMLDL